MTRTMTATVIRGNGEGVDVIVNGIVRQEIRRQREAEARAMAAEHARGETIEASRNRLLADQLAATRRALYRRPPLIKRLRNVLANAWALGIGTIIVWGEAAGLWVYEEAENEQKI